MEVMTAVTYCITGATGYVGQALVRKLAGSGLPVHALFRSKDKAEAIRSPHVTLFHGDLLDPESLLEAMDGCRFVFHTGALTGIWCRNPDLYHQINVQGTKNVIECALESGVNKIVITSTAGVFGPSPTPADETRRYSSRFFTEYEKTKADADRLTDNYRQKNIHIVIVHPTRIYGPGPSGQSNSVTRMIRLYLAGKWRFLLGDGRSRGNYVYIDDVVDGHILAMNQGVSQENYILGGENISYNRFFDLLKNVSGKKYRLVHIPYWSVLWLSKMMRMTADNLSRPPALTPEIVRKLNADWVVSSGKAAAELGYSPAGLCEGLTKTIAWIYSGENIYGEAS